MICLPELPVNLQKIRYCEMAVMQTPLVSFGFFEHSENLLIPGQINMHGDQPHPLFRIL
jgi:hypothetical protein